MDTLFQSAQFIENTKISGKTRLSGYIGRYNLLTPYCKEALIILYSENKIVLNKNKLMLIQKIDYKNFEGIVREWLKCAFYLGVIFSKTTDDHISYFLGVDLK